MFYGCVFWYRLLNCGIPLSCTGGSDFPFSAGLLAPWYPNLGLDRTYVQVDGPFTYKNWIEGIRAGRTFAGNGPLLFFTVDGKLPGSQLNLTPSEDHVLIEARVVSNYALDSLEIVQNGAVIKRVDGRGGQTEIACSERLRLDRRPQLVVRRQGARQGGTRALRWYCSLESPCSLKSDLCAAGRQAHTRTSGSDGHGGLHPHADGGLPISRGVQIR